MLSATVAVMPKCPSVSSSRRLVRSMTLAGCSAVPPVRRSSDSGGHNSPRRPAPPPARRGPNNGAQLIAAVIGLGQRPHAAAHRPAAGTGLVAVVVAVGGGPAVVCVGVERDRGIGGTARNEAATGSEAAPAVASCGPGRVDAHAVHPRRVGGQRRRGRQFPASSNRSAKASAPSTGGPARRRRAPRAGDRQRRRVTRIAGIAPVAQPVGRAQGGHGRARHIHRARRCARPPRPCPPRRSTCASDAPLIRTTAAIRPTSTGGRCRRCRRCGW